MSKPWHKRIQRRLLREIEAVRRVYPHLRLIGESASHLGWEGHVEVRGQRHFVRLLYHPDFPMSPPLLFESSPFQTEPLDDRASYHQLVDGSLCLYTVGHGPRSWSPEYTAADVLKRYVEFREIALDGCHTRDHRDDTERGLPALSGAHWVIPPSLDQFLTLPGWGRFRARCSADGHITVVSWIALGPSGPQMQERLDTWAALPLIPIPFGGLWCRIQAGASSWSEIVPSRAALERLLSESGAPPSEIPPREAPCYVLLSREAPGGGRDVVAVLSPGTARGDSVILLPVEAVDLREDVFKRVDGVLSGRQKLTDVTVVMVGLGSLGSVVALALARAGVSRFVLFDPDVLRPENICRHAADLADLYRFKVHAVASLIGRRSPSATVESYPASPLWDGSLANAKASQAFTEALARPSALVVVTTGNDQVERVVNQRTLEAGVPAVYASVLGEAEHGRIFRVLPGQTACYQCILHAQEACPEHFPSLDTAGGSLLPSYGVYRQPGVPGVGIDVDMVALLTARLSLQTLSRRVPGGLGYPDEDGDHILWTNRGGWVFDRPLQVLVQRTPRVPACIACGSGSEREPLSNDDTRRLRELLSELREPARMAPEVAIL